MGTWTIVSLIGMGASFLLHFFLPRKKSVSSSTPAPDNSNSASSDDKFANLPGLKGHPLLNAIFGDHDKKVAAVQLAEAIANSPIAAEVVKSRLGIK